MSMNINIYINKYIYCFKYCLELDIKNLLIFAFTDNAANNLESQLPVSSQTFLSHEWLILASNNIAFHQFSHVLPARDWQVDMFSILLLMYIFLYMSIFFLLKELKHIICMLDNKMTIIKKEFQFSFLLSAKQVNFKFYSYLIEVADNSSAPFCNIQWSSNYIACTGAYTLLIGIFQ